MAKVNEPLNSHDTVARAEAGPAAAPRGKLVELPHALSVRQLAELLSVSAIDIIKRMMRGGVMANINQIVDYETASRLAQEMGFEAKPKPGAAKTVSVIGEIKQKQLKAEEAGGLRPRPPVVTIMGHVDHGKTRLLDAIRQTNVMGGEAGGITQHIGAYQVEVSGQKITFLDTPGHEAFTAMRARGARATDITVLVVAADDGVMPQTLEAIDHARAAKVPIIVAINKIDKPNANPEVVKQQLAEAGLVVESWGGDVIAIPVSAKEKTGIPDLLEHILLVAEMESLRANYSRPAVGVVIEAEMDKTKGPLATVLIHDGALRLGDTVVVGMAWGNVKAMFNDVGKRLRKAGPSTPVEILGLNAVPEVGDTLNVTDNEAEAQNMAQRRKEQLAQANETSQRGVNLNNLFEKITTGKVKELNVILKVDVQGSLEPIKASLGQLSTDKVQLRVIRSSSGNITESDVMLAAASQGLIIGFNVGVETGAHRLADVEGVDVRTYEIIYNLVDDVSKAIKGVLEPTFVEVIDGRAEVRAVFPSGKKEKAAGSYITEGKATRGIAVRVRRGKKVIYESTVNSLRRFKDDVREVAAGYECGVGVDGFGEFQEGDVLEFYHKEQSG